MGSGEWYEAANALRLYEKLHDAQDSAHMADVAVKTAEYAGDDAQIQRAKKRFAERLQHLADVLNEMHRAGLRPPKLHRSCADRMAKLGMKVEG
jgi:hypothetical protein